MSVYNTRSIKSFISPLYYITIILDSFRHQCFYCPLRQAVIRINKHQISPISISYPSIPRT